MSLEEVQSSEDILSGDEKATLSSKLELFLQESADKAPGDTVEVSGQTLTIVSNPLERGKDYYIKRFIAAGFTQGQANKIYNIFLRETIDSIRLGYLVDLGFAKFVPYPRMYRGNQQYSVKAVVKQSVKPPLNIRYAAKELPDEITSPDWE